MGIDKLKGIITEKPKRVSKLSQKPKFQNKELQIIENTDKRMQKPQEIYFYDEIDNSQIPFIPKIDSKFYSLSKLSADFSHNLSLSKDAGFKKQEMKEKKEMKLEFRNIGNPYSDEILNCKVHELYKNEHIPDLAFKSLSDTPFSYIDTPQHFKVLKQNQ